MATVYDVNSMVRKDDAKYYWSSFFRLWDSATPDNITEHRGQGSAATVANAWDAAKGFIDAEVEAIS